MFAADGSVPDLKSNTTMNQLSEELASTEQGGLRPQAYNDAVMATTRAARSFPSRILAGATGFAEAAAVSSSKRAVEREVVESLVFA